MKPTLKMKIGKMEKMLKVKQSKPGMLIEKMNAIKAKKGVKMLKGKKGLAIKGLV